MFVNVRPDCHSESRNDGDGASETAVVCYLQALNTPDSVISLMAGTRPLDGRQSAEWDGITASWGSTKLAGVSAARCGVRSGP